MLEINGEFLRAALKKRGLSAFAVSEEIGYDKSFLTNCAFRGRMREATAKILEQNYSISPDEYVLKKEEPKEEQKAEFEPGVDFWKTLRMIIKYAVYEAVNQAMNEHNGKQ